MDFNKQALAKHKQFGGKITVALRDPLDSKEKLAWYYTPGVAAVSQLIAQNPAALREYTWVKNLVAVVSDGSAVLGLGNIGPRAAMPVMEGKAMLFKHFADIDAVPIVLDTSSPDQVVAAVKAIAPSFGGINLEDFAAPECFEIEERLKQELDIPVMHDDQHATAIVTLAGLLNATTLTGKTLADCKIVIIGAGAAGVAIANLLHVYAKPHITAVDSKGIVYAGRHDLTKEKKLLAKLSGATKGGTLQDALKGADVVIGVSRGSLDGKDVKLMAKKPIVFALANPNPEILPDAAMEAGAAIVATGRSDYANQINNALVFPGIFRGALDNGVRAITDQHKIAAAQAIAALVAHPTPTMIVPSVMDERVVPAVARVIT